MAMATTPGPAYLCSQCTRAQHLFRQARTRPVPRRWQANKAPAPGGTTVSNDTESRARHTSETASSHDPSHPTTQTASSQRPEPGAMSQRLQEATEEALLTGGRAGRKAVEEAGFSEELKERLFARVQDAK